MAMIAKVGETGADRWTVRSMEHDTQHVARFLDASRSKAVCCNDIERKGMFSLQVYSLPCSFRVGYL